MSNLTTPLKQLVKEGVEACIYCGSGELSPRGFKQENTTREVWEDVECKACGREWKEVYTLSDIENVDATPIKETLPGEAPEPRFTNYYRHCGQEWNDQWSSMCNDRCPECNHEIEPYKSEDIPEGS